MAGNRIYRGPYGSEAETVTRKCGAALLPGTAVLIGATFTQATAPTGRWGVLNIRDYYVDDLTTAIASGDTTTAYEIQNGQKYQMAMAAATYTAGQELTVGAAGRLAAAATGNIVVAFYDDSVLTKAAGALADVVIANFYTKP